MTEILVPLPLPRDLEPLKTSTYYRYHFLNDSNYRVLKSSPGFDILSFIQKCKNYIRNHEISGVLYTHDVNALIASVLNEECSLMGPSVESMFLATNKYYSRCMEEDPISFQAVDLWSKEIFSLVT